MAATSIWKFVVCSLRPRDLCVRDRHYFRLSFAQEKESSSRDKAMNVTIGSVHVAMSFWQVALFILRHITNNGFCIFFWEVVCTNGIFWSVIPTAVPVTRRPSAKRGYTTDASASAGISTGLDLHRRIVVLSKQRGRMLRSPESN